MTTDISKIATPPSPDEVDLLETKRSGNRLPWDLSLMQENFLKTMNQTRFVLCEGQVRSGKTFVVCLGWFMFLYHLSKNPHLRRGRLVMIGYNQTTVFSNLIELMMDEKIFGDWATHITTSKAKNSKSKKYRRDNRPSQGTNFVYIFGMKVELIGAMNRSAEGRIRGGTIYAAMIDELTIINQGTFDQLMNRVVRVFATTNPDSPAHWVKTYVIDQANPDINPHWKIHQWQIYTFTMMDNPSQSMEERKRLMTQFSGMYYRRFVLGEWVAGEGAIYGMFNSNYTDDPQDPGHVVRKGKLPPIRDLIAVGIDHGNRGASAAIVLGLGWDGNLYVVKEWRSDLDENGRKIERKGTHALTNTEQADSLTQFLNSPLLPEGQNPNLKPEYYFIDHSAQGFRTDLYQRGLDFQNANKDVAYRIERIQGLLHNRLLFVYEQAQGLIREFPSYSWGKDGKPEKSNDHSLDAFGYAVVSAEYSYIDDLRLDVSVRYRPPTDDD